MSKSIEKTLREDGYLVEVKFHKVRTATTVNPKAIGIDVKDNKELESFYDKHVKKSQISWLANDNIYLRKAQSVSKSVHKRKIKDSLDGSLYMPKTKLPAFKAYVKEKKAEYMKVRDGLVADYDRLVREFRRDLEADFLNTTVASDVERQQLIDAIMKKVPTKLEVYNSFMVEQTYMMFAMSTELMDDDDKDASLESAKIRMDEMNGVTLSVVFEKLNKIMSALWNKKYTKTQHDMVDEIIVEIDDRNIFSNSTLEAIKHDVARVKELRSLEEYEYILTKVYAAAKDIGEDGRLDVNGSILSYDQLELGASVA